MKARTGAFWKWYSNNAARFYAAIEVKQCGSLEPEVSAAVDRWLPGMAWVFGPGENKTGHSFTLTGEGILAKQFIAEYWLSCAPKIDGWSFYSSRQPSDDVRGFTLKLDNDLTFDPKELWLHLWVDTQEEKIDITAWHPLYDKISDNSKWTSLFLLLDEVLGEHGTQNWIGEIKFADHLLRESVPVWELREFTQEAEVSRGWNKHKPTETYTSYQIKEGWDGLRGDVFVGTTRCWGLIREFLDSRGPIKHPLPGVGVDFVCVAIPSEILPKGKEVEFRGEIEDDAMALLAEQQSGDTLGGCTGTKNAYLDFIIYDGDASINLIKKILTKHGIPKGTTVHHLTEDKADKVYRL